MSYLRIKYINMMFWLIYGTVGTGWVKLNVIDFIKLNFPVELLGRYEIKYIPQLTVIYIE